MKSDSEIKRDVEAELQWDPDIKADDIAVSVKDGVVTLTGFVRSYGQKWDAESAVKRLAGVAGIVNNIEVRLPIIHRRPDPEITRDAVQALQYKLPHSSENIKIVVRDGWLTLEGEVEWNYQRERAEKAVRRVRGVTGITNEIKLRPRVAPEEIKSRIEQALERLAEVDASRITVEADGRKVVLRGTVRSWAERAEAERSAWQAPGVETVDNRITVSP